MNLEVVSKLRSAAQAFAPSFASLRLCVRLNFSQRRKVKTEGAKEGRKALAFDL
jgi:hypothetical protein